MTDEINLKALVKFLEEAAAFTERQPTGGEDRQHWANVMNAENFRKAAQFIDRVRLDRETEQEELLAVEALAFERGMAQWRASLKRPDLTEEHRVGGALKASEGSRFASTLVRRAKLSPDLTPGHVLTKCRPGTAHCCRYLLMGADGWECAKLTSLREELDRRVLCGTMRATGDNCTGRKGSAKEPRKRNG